MGEWQESHGQDLHALSIVDGLGDFAQHGPHYSRRSPGSRSFTGVGREIVLTQPRAVWAVVLNRAPGGGAFFWRNMLFRNLGEGLSSDLIRSATSLTYRLWLKRYGCLPSVRLRTEVSTRRRSTNPGYCYQCAGWIKGEASKRMKSRGMAVLYAPTPHIYSKGAPMVHYVILINSAEHRRMRAVDVTPEQVQDAVALARRTHPDDRVVVIRTTPKQGAEIEDARSQYIVTLAHHLGSRDIERLGASGVALGSCVATYLRRLGIEPPICVRDDEAWRLAIGQAANAIGYHVGRSDNARKAAHVRLMRHAISSVCPPT